ncbi:EamA family transporter [Pelomonas sp. SE-A7]|uniref:EamA family transporter n=1 Tax=Pelomonas sp. SE-A7 TaxID=3054953 RepID=UPI00259C691B|nr:EamA family transporter [Pelomonas sp. SE-A7]MDM4768233.1 EamA family transporter [Pelomonas sp. SE-A7]
MSTSTLSRGDALRIAAVVLIWGLNFVVMKLGLKGLSPMLLGALRFCVAAAPLLLLWRGPPLPWRYLAAYGLAQGLGQFGLLFTGLQLGMTAGMASVVMQTQAFFTLLLAAPLLGEKARPAQWLGLSVALAGLLAIALAHGEGPGQMTLIGFALTVGAAFMWAVSNLVGRIAARHSDYDPLAFIAWSSLVPIGPFFALAFWQQGHDAIRHQIHALQGPALLAVLYLGLLATLLAYSLWTQLLKRHAPSRVVPWSLLVPVVGLLAAAVAFDEQPSPLQWAGTGAVLLGLVVNQGLLKLGRRG